LIARLKCTSGTLSVPPDDAFRTGRAYLTQPTSIRNRNFRSGLARHESANVIS
jgi:hypothetical protein